jgi:hypothetical protein
MNDQADNFEDLPPPLRGAARTYGRDMVALVYNSGIATEAAGRLAGRTDEQGKAAIRMLAWAFNETSTALARAKGWSAGQLNDCEQAIELGFAEAPAIVGSDGKVLQ